MALTVRTRSLSKKKRLLDDFSVPPPPSLDGKDGGESLTLRHVIEHVVREEVRRFMARQAERRFDRVLAPAEIDRQATRGKVDPAGRPVQDQVDPERAIGTALQAFEDGLYLVIIDEVERKGLDELVFLTPNSVLTFIRLTFLAGA